MSGVDALADTKYAQIDLQTPSRLHADDDFSAYGFIVKPGDYALTEFEVKVARSRTDVGHLRARKEDLLPDGAYYGGRLRVTANEVVYAGHFSLDCFQQPMPWRYYVEGETDFESYVVQRRKKFKFLKDATIVSRPFETTNFGADYNFEAGLERERVGDYVTARDYFVQALDFAKSSAAAPRHVSAIVYNLGRMYGYSCDFETGKQYLLEALEMERSLEAPGEANIAKRLSELARLSFDMDDYGASAVFYGEAIEHLDRLSVASDDPIAYANYLESYSVALERTGDVALAGTLQDRARDLRSSSGTQVAQFVPIRYREVCKELSRQ